MRAFNQFLIENPFWDFTWELFKGIVPTIVAIVAIVINNQRAKKRDLENKRKTFIIEWNRNIMNDLASIQNSAISVSNNMVKLVLAKVERKEQIQFLYCEKLSEINEKCSRLHSYAAISYEPYMTKLNFNKVYSRYYDFAQKCNEILDKYCDMVSESKENAKMVLEELSKEVDKFNEIINLTIGEVAGEINRQLKS